MRRSILLLLPFAGATIGAASDPHAGCFAFLHPGTALTAAERAALERGQPVVAVRDGDARRSPQVRAGDCGLKLTATELSSLQRVVEAAGAGWKTAAQAAFRRLVLQRIAAHIARSRRPWRLQRTPKAALSCRGVFAASAAVRIPREGTAIPGPDVVHAGCIDRARARILSTSTVLTWTSWVDSGAAWLGGSSRAESRNTGPNLLKEVARRLASGEPSDQAAAGMAAAAGRAR